MENKLGPFRPGAIRPDAACFLCTLPVCCSHVGLLCVYPCTSGPARELATIGIFKHACTPCCSARPLLVALEALRPATHFLVPDGGVGFTSLSRALYAVSLRDAGQMPEPLPLGAGRPPESDGLHPLYPYLGAGGQSFARLAPHAPPVSVTGGEIEKRLPSPGLAFDRLLARPPGAVGFAPCPNGANALTVCFALLLSQELVRTDTGRAAGAELSAVASSGGNKITAAPASKMAHAEERPWVNSASSFLDLQSLYGDSTLSALRARALTEGMLLERAGQTERTLRLPCVRALLALFRAEHNAVARELARREPTYFGPPAGRRADEACYQKAREITSAIFAGIVLGDFLPAIAGAPPLDRILASARPFEQRMPVPAHVSAELKLLLSLHAAVPDGWALASTSSGGLSDAQLLHDAIATPSGRLGARHTPRFLRPVEERALRWGRAMGMPSFNQARRALGLRPLRSWAELAPDVQVQAELALLYPGSIDELEIAVGAAVEAGRPGRGWSIGETALAALQAQCVASVLGDRFLTAGLSAESLTPWGLERVLATSRLAQLIARHAPAEGDTPLPPHANVWRVPPPSNGVGVESLGMART